jgi:hypothetical protein
MQLIAVSFLLSQMLAMPQGYSQGDGCGGLSSRGDDTSALPGVVLPGTVSNGEDTTSATEVADTPIAAATESDVGGAAESVDSTGII